MPLAFSPLFPVAVWLLIMLSSPVGAQDATAPAAPDAPPPAQSAATATEPEPVVIVNGRPVSRAVFEAYAAQRSNQLGDPGNPQVREILLDELIIQQLLVEEASTRELLDRDPQLRLQYRNLMATAAVRQLMQVYQPTAEAVEAEYQAMVDNYDAREYQARHILVDSEETAAALIGELDRGADFAELARAESSDSSSAGQGGDLGWFSSDDMVQSFSEAVARLEQGEYTREPVQTEFGWHVIQLNEVRETPPPPLDELHPRIVQQLQSQMINDYLVQQREQADVEINAP